MKWAGRRGGDVHLCHFRLCLVGEEELEERDREDDDSSIDPEIQNTTKSAGEEDSFDIVCEMELTEATTG